MAKTIIKVENLSKRYRLGLKEQQADTLVGQFKNLLKVPYRNYRRLRELSKFGYEDESVFWALKDVSFEVKEGEVLGIIGKNGAGKSTLLKILSQITEPTSGKIELHGRVASLLEVGTGFHPELSGRENIYMNGTILGMTKREIDQKLEEIIDFSGVEKFIDTPVKFYSSGMKVRLGFSVAAHLDPEILIIDEVLAVGDYEFQQKCLGKMEDVSKNKGRTVLFVSHNMGAVGNLCEESILLKSGLIIKKGKTLNVLKEYYSGTSLSTSVVQSKFCKMTHFSINENKNNEKVESLPHDVDFTIKVTVFSYVEIISPIIALLLKDSNAVKISTIHLKPPIISEGENIFRVKVLGGRLTPNLFTITINIHDDFTVYLREDSIYSFSIFDNGSQFKKWENKDYGKCFLEYYLI